MEGTLSNRLTPLQTLRRHPYLILAFCCLLVHAASCISGADPLPADMLLMIVCLMAGGFLLYGLSRPAGTGRRIPLIVSLGGILAIGVWTAFYPQSNFPVRYLLTGGLLFLLAAALWLLCTGGLNASRVVLLMLAAGFLLRAAYILYTNGITRQHDFWYFDNIYGHAGYIRYLYDNGHLPDFDPLTRSQYYQPPLHHAIAALWMRLNTWLGLSVLQAGESVQVLTLFYSSSCMLLSYRILRELELKGMALLVPMAILCFHPTFIILGGSSNNDILCTTLMLAAILWTIRWYHAPTFKHILFIALSVGFAMMTKLFGAMVAPAIAVVFLIKLIQNRKAPGRLIGQYAAFGAAVFPLGLWWGIRNLIRFGTPITYVPMISSDDGQYVGYIPALKRLFDFSPHQFSSVFTAWGDKNADYFEYNPTIYLLKSSLFGEYDYSFAGSAMKPAATFLFIVNTALILLSMAAFCWILFSQRSQLEPPIRAFWAVLAVVMLVSYYQFSLTFAHTCSMDIRYVVPIILVGTVMIGLMLRHCQQEGRFYRLIRGCTAALTGAFCLGSTVVYTLLAV